MLEQYLHWCIDRIRPVALDFQIKNWSEFGYIEEGYTSYDKMPSFEVWSSMNDAFVLPLKLDITPKSRNDAKIVSLYIKTNGGVTV